MRIGLFIPCYIDAFFLQPADERCQVHRSGQLRAFVPKTGARMCCSPL